MTTGSRKPMRMPKRENRSELSSGTEPARGRPRKIDISDTGFYHRVSLSVSPKTYKNLRRATAETGMNQNEFILTPLLLAIEETLSASGISH